MPAPEVIIDPQTQKPVIDPVTQKPKTISFLDKAKAALTQNNPNFLSEWKRHHNLSDALVTDDAATQQILDSFTVTPQFKQLETKEDIEKKKNDALSSGVEAKYAEPLAALKMKQIKQSIATARAQELKYKSNPVGSPFPKNYVRPNITKIDKDGNRHMSLTEPIKITATGANYVTGKDKDGKDIIKKGTLEAFSKGVGKEFEIVKITKDKNNRFLATGYVTTGGMREKSAAKQIILSKSDYNDFVGKLGGLSPIQRFSNSLSLKELGLPDIPDTYLNIPQDEKPDDDYVTVE